MKSTQWEAKHVCYHSAVQATLENYLFITILSSCCHGNDKIGVG